MVLSLMVGRLCFGSGRWCIIDSWMALAKKLFELFHLYWRIYSIEKLGAFNNANHVNKRCRHEKNCPIREGYLFPEYSADLSSPMSRSKIGSFQYVLVLMIFQSALLISAHAWTNRRYLASSPADRLFRKVRSTDHLRSWLSGSFLRLPSDKSPRQYGFPSASECQSISDVWTL